VTLFYKSPKSIGSSVAIATRVQCSGGISGNIKIKVEIHLAHFLLCLQKFSFKQLPSNRKQGGPPDPLKCQAFSVLFIKAPWFIKLYYKNEEPGENFITISDSSPDSALSRNTIFRHTRTGTIVPLTWVIYNIRKT
jgi:hypothetical protein